MPGRSGPAANDVGPMSEKPTKATFRPSRSMTCGRGRRPGRVPAPTASAPVERTLRMVSSRAPVAVVADVVVGEVEHVEPRVRARPRAARPALPRNVNSLTSGSRGSRSRTRGCRTRCRRRFSVGGHAAPRPAVAALQHHGLHAVAEVRVAERRERHVAGLARCAPPDGSAPGAREADAQPRARAARPVGERHPPGGVGGAPAHGLQPFSVRTWRLTCAPGRAGSARSWR